MTQLYYTAQFMMQRAGRKSPSAAVQLEKNLPVPDAVIVMPKRGTPGFSLLTWEQFAKTRQPKLREDLLKVIKELREEESTLVEKYTK